VSLKTKIGWANALTALRLVLVFPSCWSIATGQLALAAVVFCIAVASDVPDGRAARARGEVSKFGGLFDHSVDASFVGLSLAALALSGGQGAGGQGDLAITPLLSILVFLSFTQYALDSKVLQGQSLRASVLGRYNGIGYFVVLGTAVIGAAIGLPQPLLNPVVMVMAWLLVATTLVSMLDRFLAYRKVPDSP